MINKRLIIFLLFMMQSAVYAQQAYQLDVKKSKILWNTRQTMGGHFGYLLFSSGTLIYSSAGQPNNAVVTMDMNSIRSQDHKNAADNQKVDTRLREPGFFDIDKYPEANMRVTKIIKIAKADTYKVNGDLTIKGITNPIEFLATIKKKGEVINLSGEVIMDRLLWHIDMQQPTAQPKAWDFVTKIKNNVMNKVMVGEVPITLILVFTK